jgi:uncharacterized protein YndB with AHSA1/START domain
MTMTKTDTSTLEMHKTVKASIERVYKAWTEPEQMTKWFGCTGTTQVLVSQDLRVGGEYRISCQGCEGELVAMYGVFQEIKPNQKLVYTWNNTSQEYPAKDTVVSIEFIPRGDETEIVLKHAKFAMPVSVEGHTMGWTTALEKFAALFAA